MARAYNRNSRKPVGQRQNGDGHGDMTLTEALSDPIVQAFMSADGVDARQLELDLRQLAKELQRRNSPPGGDPNRPRSRGRRGRIQ